MLDLNDKHTYNTPGKDGYRRRGLQFVKDHGSLIWSMSKDRLEVAFCDLVGGSGDLMLQLIHEQWGPEVRFVGIDRNPKYIEPLRAQYPQHLWLVGELFQWINDSRLDDVGVLNMDLENSVSGSAVRDRMHNIRNRVARGIQKHAEFCLMINLDLDSATRRGESRSEGLWNSTAAIADGLKGYLPGRRLDPEMLLSKDDLRKVDDSSFEGELGENYDIYRSTASHRMANLRLMLI